MIQCKMCRRKMVLRVLGIVLLMLQYNGVSAQPGGVPEFADSTTAAAGQGVSELYSHHDTATTLYSADNFLKCISDEHVTPTNTQGISDLVKRHSAAGGVKIRATRRDFHSSAGFVCPGARGSTKTAYTDNSASASAAENVNKSITVLLHRMNRVVAVDAERHRLTVEAGMTLLDLADAAEANRMSVRAGAFSVYANLTVGGVIATSAHGSGLGTISNLGDLVTMVKWVNGRGDVVISDAATDAGRTEVEAVVGGLGLLGIATEFTIQLEPISRTIVETRLNLDDTNIVSDLTETLRRETPHILAHWRPDFGTYRVTMFTPVAGGVDDALPDAAPAFRPAARSAYMAAVDDKVAAACSALMAAWEDDTADESAAADVLNAGACTAAATMYGAPVFYDHADGSAVEHATLPTNYAMLAAECSPKCMHHQRHMGTAIEDMEFTIKFSQLGDWVRDVKAIIATELREVQARLDVRYGGGHVKRCMSPGYFSLRFGRGSKTLLSTNAGADDVVYVQWSSLHSAMVPTKPAKVAAIVDAIEQLTLCRYHARPHWGKNHERVFRHPTCHVRDNFPPASVAALLDLQQRHDPGKVFEPELFSHVLQRSGPAYSPQCSLAYWCYCQEDAHCPQGHACQPSAAFPEYKVCKVKASSERQHDEL